MIHYKTSITQAIRFAATNKDFLLFNYCNKTNKITEYRLTNDLNRWRKHYKTFRLTDVIKQQINTNLKIE